MNEFRLVNAGRVQALEGVELGNVGVSFDLIDVAVLMIELAADAVRAVLGSKELLAVLVFGVGPWLQSRFLLAVAMGKFALLAVPTEPDFNPVLAELSLVLLVEFLPLSLDCFPVGLYNRFGALSIECRHAGNEAVSIDIVCSHV